MIDINRERELDAQITAIQRACREAHEQLEVLLQPLREPIGAYARELKALRTARFEHETGLHLGDELELTDEFIDYERCRCNDGLFWQNIKGTLQIADGSIYNYHAHGTVCIGKDGIFEDDIPVPLARQMREKYLQVHPQPAAE